MATIFSFFGGKKTAPESKIPRRNNNPTDMTGGLQGNEELFEGLIHGTYQGLQKATPLARIPVLIPAMMMGYPTPKSKDENTQAVLDQLIKEKTREINIIKRKYLNVGTTWVYPKWDSSANTLVWKIIKDSSIPDLMVSLLNERLETIIVDEQITITTAENTRQIVNRKTTYTKDKVTVKYTGAVNGLVKDISMRNIAGTIPIMFAHEPDDAISRGHAVNEPILCDLKDYHDIAVRVSKTIAGFTTKQVQDIKDIKTWRHNNGLDSDADLADYDVALVDLIMNLEGEKTSYLHLPADATGAGEVALKREFLVIIQGTSVAEIFWGGAIQGNNGSYSDQMQSMINIVKEYRSEVTPAFKDLFVSSLILLGLANNETYDLDIEMNWNRLTSISEKDQASILQQFCSAMSGAVTSGCIGIHQLYEMWNKNYSDIQYESEDSFKADLVKTANLQQFLKQDSVTGEELIQAAGDTPESIIDSVNK
jgi:hypothetical protein